MFCSHCGKEIRDDASFCPECGTPVYRKDETQKAAENVEKGSPVSDSEQPSASDTKQEPAGGGGTFIRLSRILTAELITTGRGKMRMEGNREKARRAR